MADFRPRLISIDGVSVDLVAREAPKLTFARGVEYLRSGAILDLERNSWGLWAQVKGSADQPYRVEARLGSKGLGTVTCTCPYNGFCKHIVAVLLAWLERNGVEIPARPDEGGD